LYDLVLVDVEGVDTWTRLHIRLTFARTGIPSYVRIAGSELDMERALASFCAYHDADDRIWRTAVGLSNEIIMGGGEAPMGLYHTHSMAPSHEVSTYQAETALTPDEKQTRIRLAYWSLSGEITYHDAEIASWVQDNQRWPEPIRDELSKLKTALDSGVDTQVSLPKHLIRGYLLLWTLFRDMREDE
jgi:hypothetical protein